MKKITLEDLQPWENPGDGWYNIERWGEHPQQTADGKKYVQVIDDEAVRAIVEAGVPEEGLLTDVEHVSVAVTGPRDSRAYGWVRELAALPTEEGLQLCARIEWTPLGLPLVRDRIYKHFSTVYSVELCADLGGGRLRPLQLVGLALTNQPNNPGQRPITNSQAAPINDNTNQQDNNMEELKKIAAKLGLPEDAALDQILATIDALMAAEQEAAEAEAETLLNSEDLATLTPEEKKDLKEELLTNREMGIKMINLLANRKGGGTSGGAPKYARPGYRRETQATRGGKGMGTDRGQLLVNTARDIQAQEKAAGRLCSFWKAKNLAKIRLGQK